MSNEQIYDKLMAISERALADEFAESMNRLAAVERMITEVADLESDQGTVTFEVDEIVRDGDGKPVTIFGTRNVWGYGGEWYIRSQEPYIIGDV